MLQAISHLLVPAGHPFFVHPLSHPLITIQIIHKHTYKTFTTMLRSALRPAQAFSAGVSARLASQIALQRRLASSLVFLEHKGGKLNDSSLSAVTAANKIGEVSMDKRGVRCDGVGNGEGGEKLMIGVRYCDWVKGRC